MEVLAGEGVAADRAAQYLAALSVSHGFSISLMFLEAEQKQGEVAREGWRRGWNRNRKGWMRMEENGVETKKYIVEF